MLPDLEHYGCYHVILAWAYIRTKKIPRFFYCHNEADHSLFMSTAMFHKLLFLGPGGRTVYQGDVEGAKEYFDGMGYPCPANINPADHYMDVIGGVLKKSDKKFDPVVLFDAWARHAKEQKSMHVNETDHGDGIKCDSLQVLVKPGMK